MQIKVFCGTEILPHFRKNTQYEAKKCYHCHKGQLKDHFSCKVIDKFQKETKACQCDKNDASSESSHLSYDLSSNEGSLPPLLTNTELSEYSDYEISDNDCSREDLMLDNLYVDMEA